MESRIKQLRENRGLIQEILASELGITQQMLSKYERDVLCIKVDVLKRIAEYFNVTTDYLLGTSDVKRDVVGAVEMGKTLEEYYDLVELYRGLKQCDQKIVLAIIAIIKNARSGKMGKKDIIKIEGGLDLVDLDVLGFVDHNITVNIIKNGEIVDKKRLSLPKQVTNIIKCKNPRCITSIEQGLKQVFVLADEEKQVYRCKYCEEKYS